MAEVEDFAPEVEEDDAILEENQEEVVTNEANTGEEKAAAPDPLESLYKFHPEAILDYSETVAPKIPLRAAPSSEENPDAIHRSQPFLTLYEKTKILGFRANQISQGARPYVDVPEYVTSELEIARMELEQRRLPFILKRPMPDGSFEYWRLSDLMVLKD
jgi:DNA-directed RNA polymerase subunit K/omega